MADLQRLRDDVGYFAGVAGRPLEVWQATALALEALVTAIVAPRQSGKSRSLSVLAVWWAFRRREQRVLIISAGEEAAKRLLAAVRSLVAGSPLLRGSVVDESTGLVTLTNGSEIRSVPASERQVRGWSVDLLLVDEAALVGDDLLLGAAFPTVAARPDARIVLASSATTAAGAFYDHVVLGRQGAEHVRAFAWALTEAWWIAPSVIAAARASMSATRFAAEYEGVFASGADAMFPRHLLDAVTADVVVPGFEGLRGAAGLLGGQDWGATTDRSALVAVGRLEAPRGMLGVVAAHAWRSGAPLDGPGGVIGELVDVSGSFELLTGELNGLGLPLVQELQRRVRARWAGTDRPPRVVGVTTSAAMKSATYSALRLEFEQRRLVIPASAAELRRELLLLRVAVLPAGGERIEAGVGHDDLADALMLAAAPYRDANDEWRSRLRDVLEREPLEDSEAWTASCGETVTTGAGVRLPRAPRFAAVGVPRDTVRTESYMDAVAEPVIAQAGMRLVGERYLDRDERGALVPPRGWSRT